MSAMLEELMNSYKLPTVEVRHPKPGLRHNKTETLVHHRFPIKNGITPDHVLIRVIEKNNALFSMMMERSKVKRKSAAEVAQDRITRRLIRGRNT